MYKNIEDRRACSARHYQKNKESYVQRSTSRRATHVKASKEYVDQYLKEHPCVDCSEADPIVLEFDHVIGEKKMNLSDMILQGYGLGTIKDEISKCEIRCANCHRKITHKRREERAMIIKWIGHLVT